MRSGELTLPGFVHDICSTVQGTSTASPFFRDLDLARFGVELIDPPAPLAHPLDGGRVAVLERSVADTAAGLGDDGAAYRRLMGPLVRDADKVMDLVLGPIFRVPRHPIAAARFGLPALRSAVGLARSRFKGDAARALLGGVSAHSMLELDRPVTASFGLVLAITAHAYGWPVVRGGTQRLADALADELRSLGGEIVTDHPVTSLADLPPARAVLFDTSPRALAAIAAAGSRTAIGGASKASATDPGSSRSTGPSASRSRGRPRVPLAPAPSTSADRWTRSDPPRPRSTVAGTRSDRSSSSSSRAASTRAALRTVGTRAGRTATSRAARRST